MRAQPKYKVVMEYNTPDFRTVDVEGNLCSYYIENRVIGKNLTYKKAIDTIFKEIRTMQAEELEDYKDSLEVFEDLEPEFEDFSIRIKQANKFTVLVDLGREENETDIITYSILPYKKEEDEDEDQL